MLLALFGVLRGISGEMLIDGKPTRISCPRKAKSPAHRHGADPRGPQDRGADAADVGGDNLSFAALGGMSRGGIIDRGKEQQAVAEMIKLLAIKTDGTAVPAGSLWAATSRSW